MLAETRSNALRQLGRVAGQVDANKLGIPGAKEEVRDVLLEVIAEPEEQMPRRAEVLKDLGRAWYQLTRARTPNRATIKGAVAEALGAIKVEPVSEGEAPPPKEEPKPPPSGGEGPSGNWSTQIEDRFPQISPFVTGSDNKPQPTGNGEYMEFHLPAGGERCEISTAPRWKPGAHLLWEAKVTYVKCPYASGGHFTTWQFKGLNSGDGSPNFSVEPRNDKGTPGLYVQEKSDLYGGGGDKWRFLCPIPEGEVLEQIEFLVDKNRHGFFRFFQNGKKLADVPNVNTLQTISAEGFIKNGAYRHAVNSETFIRVRDERVKVAA